MLTASKAKRSSSPAAPTARAHRTAARRPATLTTAARAREIRLRVTARTTAACRRTASLTGRCGSEATRSKARPSPRGVARGAHELSTSVAPAGFQTAGQPPRAPGAPAQGRPDLHPAYPPLPRRSSAATGRLRLAALPRIAHYESAGVGGAPPGDLASVEVVPMHHIRATSGACFVLRVPSGRVCMGPGDARAGAPARNDRGRAYRGCTSRRTPPTPHRTRPRSRRAQRSRERRWLARKPP
jgi:hypothetical protein